MEKIITKASIRKAISAKRRSLNHNLKEKFDKLIQKKLENSIEWKKAKNILIYISHIHEVNTINLIKSWSKEKNFIIPKTNKKKLILTLHEFKSFEDLILGNYNILEPKKNSKIVKPKKIDLAIIPGIAFDLNGNRIGYGKAYYDYLMPYLSCLKIGLAYSVQIVDNIPAEKHDQKIDILITDKKIYKFNS
jgi:5-formyltetrahydrofolate cyclo-ligase